MTTEELAEDFERAVKKLTDVLENDLSIDPLEIPNRLIELNAERAEKSVRFAIEDLNRCIKYFQVWRNNN